ncbi:hypothetical protein O9993_05320 [Vibrio lentus]|nr:hypothetical protein [Vibrio lentus]
MNPLIVNFGESKGLPLSKEYMRAFPRSYKEDMMLLVLRRCRYRASRSSE